MSVSYFRTVESLWAAQGLAYAKLTKAMKVHVRSLQADGYTVWVDGDDAPCAYDDPAAMAWFTPAGLDYVEMLAEAGLVDRPAHAETVQEPEADVPSEPVEVEAPVQEVPKRSRRGRKVSRRQGTPKARVQAESPVVPEGVTATRVPGNHLGDQLLMESVPTHEDLVKQLESLQRTVSALKAVVLA